MLLAVAVMRAADVRVVVEVREWGTMSPVPGARVEVSYGPRFTRTAIADQAGRTVIDVSRGGGASTVTASAEGFASIEGPQPLVLPEAASSMSLRVQLTRKRTLTGMLFDKETERPLPGYRVQLLRETLYRGERMFEPMEMISASGEDGRFELNGFLPPTVALRIEHRELGIRVREVKGPLNEELPERKGRVAAYWPGTHEAPDHAIAIANGLNHELGKVYVNETALYSAAVSVEGQSCNLGGNVDVSVFRRNGLVRERIARAIISCGSGFVVENLVEGDYDFEAVREGVEMAARRLWVGRNERIKLLARPGTFARIGIFGDKKGGQIFATLAHPDGLPETVDTVRPFWMRPDEPYEFDVRGVAPGYFFESILVPGGRLEATDVVRLPGGQLTSVQLVIAKPAALMAGRVIDARGEPVSALIEAVREGAPRDRKRATAGRDGKFSLRGLAPGRYRVFAADAEELAVFVEAKAGEPAWAEVRGR